MIELNFLLLLAVGILTFYNIVMLKKHVVNFYNRLALAHNDIVPMPWEIEELEKIERELDIKKEGNVVYINREETE